jgi:uncharacterized membrane protein YfcA
MHRMSARTLSLLFGAILLVAGLRMIFGADPLTGSGDLDDPIRMAIALGIGLAAGFFAGVAGIGGGELLTVAGIGLFAVICCAGLLLAGTLGLAWCYQS